MKTMQNFAAQQLTKKQMNVIKGGRSFCSIYDENGVDMDDYDPNHPVSGHSPESAEVAQRKLNQIYAAYGWSVVCIDA